MAGDSGERKRLQRRQSPGHTEHRAAARSTDTAPVQPELTETQSERRGKENSPAEPTAPEPPTPPEKMEDAGSDGPAGTADPGLFFDEDSNQIFPVEQFFGNLDSVQDCSRRASGTEGMSRREYRRRHYYAKEDSDEEQT